MALEQSLPGMRAASPHPQFSPSMSLVVCPIIGGRYRSESELIAAANQRNKPPEWNTVLTVRVRFRVRVSY